MIGGIDPGLSGGFALVSTRGELVKVLPLNTSKSIKDLIKLFRPYRRVTMFVEAQWPRPGNSGLGARTLMKNYGKLLAALDYLDMKVEEVAPNAWSGYYWGRQKHTKEDSIVVAKKLFKLQTLEHDGPAEAMLIAKYGLDKTLSAR